MKTLLFGFIAALMTTVSFGQTLSEASKNGILNAQMLAFVDASKSVYVKGQTYDGFVGALMVPSPTFPSQDEFYKKLYSYVSNNTSAAEILKSDNSSLKRFAQDLAKNPKILASETGKAPKGKKNGWMHFLNQLVNIIIEIIIPGDEPVQDVDLFPRYE